MATVPRSEGPSIREAAAPGAYQAPVEDNRLKQFAGGLNQLGETVDKVVQRTDQDAAWRTQATINDSWVKFDADSRQNEQGNKAAGYATRVQQWWQDAAKQHAETLNPSAKALISRNLTVAQGQAYKGALEFENRELERSRAEALTGAMSAEISRGSAGGPTTAGASAEIIKSMVQKFGADTGKPPEWIAQQTMQQTTALHSNVIGSLMQTDPKAAEQYFNANKGQIDGARHDEIGNKLTAVSAVVEGDNRAQEIWNSAGAGKPGLPLEVDKLMAAAREAYPNDPKRREVAMQGIQQRASAFEHAEQQRAAGNTNSVYKMLDSGASLARVRSTPEWQAMPGNVQSQILYQQEQRGAARASRAASEEARGLAHLERQQKLALLENAGSYLRASDPAVLGALSRQQVEALRPMFGLDATQHLLQKWDTLQTKDGKMTASIDTEDFNHIADGLGLNPYKASTEDKKRELGELKYRVEQLIDKAQSVKKAPLTREEKGTLMRDEMARTVTVDPGWFSSNKNVPVIQLNTKQIKDVIVPEVDRKQIAEALQKRYAETKDPMYAPTQENMRRLYLMNTSRAAGLINGQ